MQIAVGGCLAQKDRGEITARRRGSTSCSARTTSARCRCCSSGRGTTPRRRSRSSSRSRSSRPRCRRGASRPTPPGSRSRSAATTPARSASCRRCAARRRTAGRATSSPRSRRSSPRASSRSRCSARTSTPTAWSSATGGVRQAAAGLRRGRRAGAGAVHLAAPPDFTDDVIAAMAETPERHAAAAHAAAVRLRPGAQGDAPLVPQRAVPRHHRPGPRRDARRRDHHRHHRRLPRRDRRRLRADARGRRGGPVRRRLHLPVLAAPRHAGGDAARPGAGRSCRSATSGWSRWSTRSPGTRTSTQVGRTVEVLVAEGEGRKDAATHRLSGRAPDNRLVHFDHRARDAEPSPRPGDVVTVEVTYAAPHHLVADGGVGLRRTRAGDAWEARTQPAPPASSSACRRWAHRLSLGLDGSSWALALEAVSSW